MLTFGQRVSNILLSDLTPIRFILGFIAAVLSFGFFFSSASNDNYAFLVQVFSVGMWGLTFLVYGISNIASTLFYWSFKTKSVISTIGIFLWSYIFLSFVVFDPTPIYSTEWMLLFPIILEVWLLAETLHKK